MIRRHSRELVRQRKPLHLGKLATSLHRRNQLAPSGRSFIAAARFTRHRRCRSALLRAMQIQLLHLHRYGNGQPDSHNILRQKLAAPPTRARAGPTTVPDSPTPRKTHRRAPAVASRRSYTRSRICTEGAKSRNPPA